MNESMNNERRANVYLNDEKRVNKQKNEKTKKEHAINRTI